MASIQVDPIRTPRERRLVLKFPWRVYRDDLLGVLRLVPQL
jgi:hypothetical protein